MGSGVPPLLQGTVLGNLGSLKVILIKLAEDTPIFSKFRTTVMENFKVLDLSSTSTESTEWNSTESCKFTLTVSLKMGWPTVFWALQAPPTRRPFPTPPLGDGPFPPPRPQTPTSEMHSFCNANIITRFIDFVISASEAGNYWCEHTFKKHNFIELRMCNSVASVGSAAVSCALRMRPGQRLRVLAGTRRASHPGGSGPGEAREPKCPLRVNFWM